jgi:hypothetical protein
MSINLLQFTLNITPEIRNSKGRLMSSNILTKCAYSELTAALAVGLMESDYECPLPKQDGLTQQEENEPKFRLKKSFSSRQHIEPHVCVHCYNALVTLRDSDPSFQEDLADNGFDITGKNRGDENADITELQGNLVNPELYGRKSISEQSKIDMETIENVLSAGINSDRITDDEYLEDASADYKSVHKALNFDSLEMFLTSEGSLTTNYKSAAYSNHWGIKLIITNYNLTNKNTGINIKKRINHCENLIIKALYTAKVDTETIARLDSHRFIAPDTLEGTTLVFKYAVDINRKTLDKVEAALKDLSKAIEFFIKMDQQG